MHHLLLLLFSFSVYLTGQYENDGSNLAGLQKFQATDVYVPAFLGAFDQLEGYRTRFTLNLFTERARELEINPIHAFTGISWAFNEDWTIFCWLTKPTTATYDLLTIGIKNGNLFLNRIDTFKMEDQFMSNANIFFGGSTLYLQPIEGKLTGTLAAIQFKQRGTSFRVFNTTLSSTPHQLLGVICNLLDDQNKHDALKLNNDSLSWNAAKSIYENANPRKRKK
jgi:hypothetical protein